MSIAAFLEVIEYTGLPISEERDTDFVLLPHPVENESRL